MQRQRLVRERSPMRQELVVGRVVEEVFKTGRIHVHKAEVGARTDRSRLVWLTCRGVSTRP